MLKVELTVEGGGVTWGYDRPVELNIPHRFAGGELLVTRSASGALSAHYSSPSHGGEWSSIALAQDGTYVLRPYQAYRLDFRVSQKVATNILLSIRRLSARQGAYVECDIHPVCQDDPLPREDHKESEEDVQPTLLTDGRWYKTSGRHHGWMLTKATYVAHLTERRCNGTIERVDLWVTKHAAYHHLREQLEGLSRQRAA